MALLDFGIVGHLSPDLKENVETAKDSAIDIINYAAFLIAKINRGDKK